MPSYELKLTRYLHFYLFKFEDLYATHYSRRRKTPPRKRVVSPENGLHSVYVFNCPHYNVGQVRALYIGYVHVYTYVRVYTTIKHAPGVITQKLWNYNILSRYNGHHIIRHDDFRWRKKPTRP